MKKKSKPKRIPNRHRVRASRKASTLGYRCETYRVALNLRYPGNFTLAAVARKLSLRPADVRAVEDGKGTVRDWFALCELYGLTPSRILSVDMAY